MHRRRRGIWSLLAMVVVVTALAATAGVGSRDARGGDGEYTADVSIKPSAGRVINGKQVDDVSLRSRYPGLVALLDTRRGSVQNSQFFCGGTLVAPNKVLTAAHCADATTVASLRVLAGTSWIDETNRTKSQLIGASAITIAPGWNKYSITKGNDLAVVTLSSAVKTGTNVTPMSVVGPGEDPIWGAGKGVTAAPERGPWLVGWGDTTAGTAVDTYPRYAQDTNFQILPDASCTSNAYFGSSFQSTLNMCAGGKRTADDTVGSGGCHGDSGGPVMANANGAWRVVGVVSYGANTCDPTLAAAYVKVASYRTWLQQQGVSIGNGTVAGPLPAPSTTGRGYLTPIGDPVVFTEPGDGMSYDKLDQLVPLRWTLRSDQRATDVIVRREGVEVVRQPAAGLIGMSVPLGGMRAGAYTWCVASADDTNGAPGGEACRAFTRVAAHNAGLTRASFRGKRASYTGQLVSTEPTVKVSIQVRAGRKLVAKKSLVVNLPGSGKVTKFSFASVVPRGVRPRALVARIVVEGGGAKRAFTTTLR